MGRFFILAMTVILLAACGHRAAPTQSIAAPTPGDVALRITAADAGKAVTVPVGSRFAVELVGVPTAGYLWAPASIPPFLIAADTLGGPTHSDQLKPGFTGGSHWEVFVFEALAAGSGDLVIEQRRPWETDEPPVDTFAVTIEAR